MTTYHYTTTSLGPVKHYNNLEDAINGMIDYSITLPMVQSPHLHVETDDGILVGDLYIVDRDVKIMSGEDNPDIVHICSLLRNTLTRRLRKVTC